MDVGDARVLLARGQLELVDRRVELRLDLLQLPGRRLPQDCAIRVQRLAGAKLAVDRVLVVVPRLRVAPERMLGAQLADRRRSGDLFGREALGHGRGRNHAARIIAPRVGTSP